MRINWTLIGSLALNVALAIFLLKGCNCNCEDAVVIKHTIDTVRVKVSEVVPVITTSVPKVRKIIRASSSAVSSLRESDEVSPVAWRGTLQTDAPFAQDDSQTPCDDLVIYSDTIDRPDEYKAVIADTVYQNRLTGRKISFWNLTPKIVERIEKIIPLRERVRLYAGVFAGVQGSYSEKKITNWSAGPELLLTIPAGAAVGYGYDAHNNGHQLHLMWKIKLKK